MRKLNNNWLDDDTILSLNLSVEDIFFNPLFNSGECLIKALETKFNQCNNEIDGLKALYSIRGNDREYENVKNLHLTFKKMFINRFPNVNEFIIRLVEVILNSTITLYPHKKDEIHIGSFYERF